MFILIFEKQWNTLNINLPIHLMILEAIKRFSCHLAFSVKVTVILTALLP